jgi:hypothetical protein
MMNAIIEPIGNGYHVVVNGSTAAAAPAVSSV